MLKLEFTAASIEEMARFAFSVNEATENIGARRLHTIMERVLDEISFVAPDLTKAHKMDSSIDLAAAAQENGATVPLPVSERLNGSGQPEMAVVITPEYVRLMVASIVKDQDLSRYIL